MLSPMLTPAVIVLAVAALVVIVLVAGVCAVREGPRPPSIDVTPAQHPDEKAPLAGDRPPP